MPSKKRPQRNTGKRAGPLHKEASVVGPDSFQLLEGELFGKKVALILCGESHNDAIDVTRSGGRFLPREGWVELPNRHLPAEGCSWACRILNQTKKLQPLAKAQEWAKDLVENDTVVADGEIVLAWIEVDSGRRGSRGKSYVLELRPCEDLQREAVTDDEEDEEDQGINLDHWLHFDSGQDMREQYPLEISSWILKDATKEVESSEANVIRPLKLYEWGDLDPEAFAINKKRLTHEHVSASELDAMVNKRKEDRKRQNIWTFDDWFSHLKSNAGEASVHLVAEATVPPWEVELRRPLNTAESRETSTLPPAVDCLRCVSEDTGGSSIDDHDAASDGVGGYLDYLYRRFMSEMMQETQASELIKTAWFHCIDIRDLGCEGACHADAVKEKWKDLLTPEEWETATKSELEGATVPIPQSEGRKEADNTLPFRPATLLSGEQQFYEEKLRNGELVPDDESDDEFEDESDLEFTFPSFEGFFGQSTDFLYYSPHIQVSYSPFLAKAVRSSSNWDHFFSCLFFGGTIRDSMKYLDLPAKADHLYVRSPILKEWDAASNAYIWRERPEPDEHISFPFFPYGFHLKAKGSEPSRTWSSQLHNNLYASKDPLQKEFAESVTTWIIRGIKYLAEDPKLHDDAECGGEWFEGYLRAAHRDIYDDIDLSDPGELLKRNNMPSETGGRKHCIGKIKIPNCDDAFEEIVRRFENSPINATGLYNPIESRTETLAKIIIDIWMLKLVDFCALLKIGNIVAQEESTDKVIVVSYMGLSHTRTMADFFCNHSNFQKRGYFGKVAWEDDESRKIQLPSKLWNPSELF